MGIRERELNPNFIFSKGIVLHVDHSASLFLCRAPVSQVEFLSRTNFHGQSDERPVGIYDHCEGIFFQWRFPLYLRANENRNPQHHSLGSPGFDTRGQRTL